MIKEVNRAFGRLNEKLGISASLPTPGKKALKTASACNLIVGAGLITAGVLFPSKWCAALGCIALAGSAVLRKESHK